MAKPKNPKGGAQLVPCLNYGTCQTMVSAANRGNPHKYGVWNADKGEMEYKNCSG
jgi:hypothetical protein